MRKKVLLVLVTALVFGGCIRKDDLTWVKEAVKDFNDSDVTIASEEGIIKTKDGEETVDKTTVVWDEKDNSGYEKMEYKGASGYLYTYYQKYGEKIQSFNGKPDEEGEVEYSVGKEYDTDDFKIACHLVIAQDAKLNHEGVHEEDGVECIKIKVTETMKESYSDKMIKQGIIDKEAMEKDTEAKKVLEQGYTAKRVYYIWLESKTHELLKKQEDSTIPMQLIYYAAKTSGAGEIMNYPESAVYVTKYWRNKEYEKIEKPR